MEFVKDVVKKAMPSLSSDQTDTLMAKLEELGVLSVDDLALVDVVEIKDTLPLIQCKRFVRAIQALQAGEIFLIYTLTPQFYTTLEGGRHKLNSRSLSELHLSVQVSSNRHLWVHFVPLVD